MVQNRMLAFLIMKDIHRHMDVEDLERYSMGNSSPAESEPIEEHLLTCEECRNRLRETDDYLLAHANGLAAVAAGRNIRRESASGDSLPGYRRWRRWPVCWL